MESNKTGTAVFLVPFQISFLYPPLLHIELRTDDWQQMHITFLSLFPMKSVERALKFEYSTETNETGTVVFLVRFQIYLLYPPLLHIELSNDVPHYPDRFLLPKSVLQKFFFRALKLPETATTGTVVFFVRFCCHGQYSL